MNFNKLLVKVSCTFIALSFLIIYIGCDTGSSSDHHTKWTQYGGGPDQSKYFVASQITNHTIPHPGEFGYDTWPKDANKYVGGVNVWSEITIDPARGIAYLPLGSPTYDYYGAHRIGSNLFGNSLVALDARTGKRLWHFQTVHHDLWDYDLSAAPQLITVNRNSKRIDAVAVATKHGFMFVFDRVTGEPVFPIEEKPFPASEMPGEKSWPTQPISSLPSFIRHEVTKETLNPYLPDSIKIQWYKRLDSAKSGLYVPPSDKYETIMMPGALGGANYGNTAADLEKDMRVLKWIVERVHGSASALESPIGWMPRYRDMDWTGSDFTKTQFREIMAVDREAWKAELLNHEELFARMYDKLPKEFIFMKELLLSSLWRSPEHWGLQPERV